MTRNSPNGCHQLGESLAELYIDWYQNARAKAPKYTTTLGGVISTIRSDRFAGQIAELRQLLEAGDGRSLDEAKELKKKLPAVSLSGVVTGARAKAAKEGRFTHTGLIQLDIDEKDHPDRSLEDMRRVLVDDPHVVAVFTSPSGRGLKGIARVNAIDDETHLACYRTAEKHFAAKGFKLDPACKDPVRLCFISHDPDVYFSDIDGPALDPIEEAVPSAQPSQVKNPSGGRRPVISRPQNRGYDLDVDTVREMLDAIPPHPPYDEWLRISSAVWNTVGETEGTALLKHWSPEDQAGEYAEKFQQRLTEVTGGTLVHVAKKNGWRRSRPNVRIAGICGAKDTDLLGFDWTDYGNAERIHALFGENLRYVRESGHWLTWLDEKWLVDTDGGIVRLAVETMRRTVRQAIDRIKDPRSASDTSARALKSTNRKGVDDAIAMLKSIEGITVSACDLNSDPWLAGVQNGVVDLRNGEAVAPQRDMLITKSMGTTFSPDAECPLWVNFINDVTGGNTELANYLQVALGYTLTGLTVEQCLFFCYGSGANGKSVFLEVARQLIGEYSKSCPESLFMRVRDGGATNDLAALTGARLAVATELNDGSAFDEARIKLMTGCDPVPCRYLYKEFFSYLPNFCIWISGNHKPSISGTDTGIWRRFRLVPFTVTIPPDRRDPQLTSKLLKELPGILNWALEGTRRWQVSGLSVPSCVKDATAEYQQEEDVVGQFLDEYTVKASDARVLRGAVYHAYREEWAMAQGINERFRLTANRFNRRMRERGVREVKSHGNYYWVGLKLKHDHSR